MAVSRGLPESSYAVLGLIDKQPASGYELAALADRALGYFWPISRTLVYRELERLEGLGWARAVEVSQARLPDKRVWSTTGEGRQALADWLTRPAVGGSSFRSGVLLKFMFGSRMSPAALAALLADYRESLAGTVTDLTALVQRLESSPEATMGRLAALHGLRTAAARLAWLDEIEPELLGSPSATERAPYRTLGSNGDEVGSGPARTEHEPVAPRAQPPPDRGPIDSRSPGGKG